MNQLSAREVQNAQLPPGKSEHELHDGGNLVLRLRKTSTGMSKAWQFPYRFAGARDKLHIGNYPAITLAAARLQADAYRTELAQGIDPKAKKVQTEAVVLAERLATTSGAAPATFRELFERWHTDYLSSRRADGGESVRVLFEKHILIREMGQLQLQYLSVKHIKSILDTMHAKELRRSCGVALANIRQMVHWAATFEWIGKDPTLGLKKGTWGGNAREIDRTLSDDEIVQLAWRLKKSKLPARWKHACWLITATGTRVEETLLAERAHVNLAKRTWTIPVANQKQTNNPNPKPHVVHLSSFAMLHLKVLLELPGTSKFMFPARTRKGDKEGFHPVDEKTLTKALNNLQGGTQKGRRTSSELLLEGGTFTPHDLRRTTATAMQELGVAQAVVDKCLNHTVGDKIVRTYQRGELRAAMTAAWDTLGAHLEELMKKPDPEPEAAVAVDYGDDI